MKNIKPSQKFPIGIFDSGLGGLTVLKSIEKILPNESFIYFGDTAHVPYGTKSTETVIRYSRHIMDFFQKHKTKAVVIACNTASAVAFQHLQKLYDIPLFDVVTPSVEFAINHTKNKNIGVVGTFSTIYSNAYTNMFQKLRSGCNVKEIACPLFVPIIEEGWADTDIAEDIAKNYFYEFQNINIDILILGCTHYPIMVRTIRKVLSNKINLVYSGKTVGIKLKKYLKKENCENPALSSKPTKYFVTDFPQKFDEIGSRFLGRKLNNVIHIPII